MRRGITIGLFGDTGAGKTAQSGEYAKVVFKERGQPSWLNSSDLGGYSAIEHIVEAGIIRANELTPDDDPWIWINNAVEGVGITNEGLVIFDGGTSMAEALLTACHKSDFQIGQQRTQRFAVTRGSKTLSISINNEAHYGVVQGFLLDAIWRSTWMTRRGVDVIWTFSTHRSEEQDRTPILGPKLAGKALTAAIPKWFKYTFRIASIPVEGAPPTHRLYLSEHPEFSGLGHGFSNARYPLGVTPLPAFIEPASLPEALRLINEGHQEALASL